MSDEKFTQGKWSVSPRTNGIISTESNGLNISGAHGHDAFEYYGGYLICESVSECNAHLISAAPDMYRALQQAKCSMLDSGYSPNGVIIQSIDQALAKADGGQSND